jgi:hypothetical protein
MYRDLRDHNSVFSGLIATNCAEVGVQWHSQPEPVDAELVSGNYFDNSIRDAVRPKFGKAEGSIEKPHEPQIQLGGLTIPELLSLDAALEWQRDAPRPRSVLWKSDPFRLNTCAGSQVE